MAKKKFRKNFNTRVIKPNFSYSVDALAECLKVHKQTLYIWKKEGLEPIDNNFPIMFYGATIIAFLNKRKNARKLKCQPDEFLCFTCKIPRKTFDSKVRIIPLNKTMVNLCGECVHCRRLMFKTTAASNLPEILKYFQAIEQP